MRKCEIYRCGEYGNKLSSLQVVEAAQTQREKLLASSSEDSRNKNIKSNDLLTEADAMRRKYGIDTLQGALRMRVEKTRLTARYALRGGTVGDPIPRSAHIMAQRLRMFDANR